MKGVEGVKLQSEDLVQPVFTASCVFAPGDPGCVPCVADPGLPAAADSPRGKLVDRGPHAFLLTHSAEKFRTSTPASGKWLGLKTSPEFGA